MSDSKFIRVSESCILPLAFILQCRIDKEYRKSCGYSVAFYNLRTNANITLKYATEKEVDNLMEKILSVHIEK